MNKSIASTHRQKNNGYSAFTEYPLSRLPTPSDKCHNRNFWNYFLMSTRVMGGCSCWTRGRSLRVPFPNHHFNKNIPPFGRIFLLERVMGLTGGTGAVPPPARGTRKRYTVSFPPLAGTFPSSPIPQSSFQQKYPPIREDISVGAGNGTRTHYLSLEG